MPQFPSSLRSKLPKAGTTIFTVMSALASEHNAINLSQGFPDFLCHPDLMELVDRFVREGKNQYAPMPGLLALREIIAEKVFDLYGAQFSPESEITITPGGTEAIYAAITATVHEGDEVIVFEPAYDSYVPAIELSRGIPVYIELQAPDYRIPWEQVKKRVNQKTRMIMINTPHNPCGTTLSAEDMRSLEHLVNGTDIIVLSDEVYEHIIFDNEEHQSVLRFPKLAERSFVVFSFGKTYHNTGWKMGYCLAPEILMREFRRVHQFIVFSSNTPYQYAFAELMKRKELYLGLPEFYQQKRDKFNSLAALTKFKFKPSSGSYFQLLSYGHLTEDDDKDFAVRLTKDFGVASVPMSAFYHRAIDNKMLRFCFAKKNETIEAAMEKLIRFA